MNQNTSDGGMWPIVIVAMIIAIIASFVGSNNATQQATTSEPTRASNEHRYATERFKLEGYNTTEAKQAADAILKFHNAQKAR
jgi:hypothetical protein